MTRTGWMLLTGMVLLVGGCDAAPDAPAAPDTGMRMPPPEWARGAWIVTGHTIPGVSAMSNADASLWDGRVLEVSDSAARGHDAACNQPSYRERLVANDSLALGHRVAIGELPLTGSSSTVLDVLCEGTEWAAFGGRLIVIHPDTVLAPWDGVFFVLGRR